MPTIRMMWRTGALAACTALLLAGAAHAQSGDLTIGVVSVGAVTEQSPQWRAAREALNREFQPRFSELEQQRTALQEKQETYQRDRSVMGEQERVALEREIRDGERDLQRAAQVLQEDINIRQNEEINAVQTEIAELIRAYARDAGYDLILSDSVVVFKGDAVDITADVIEVVQNGGGG